jgi:hypothetical protein
MSDLIDAKEFLKVKQDQAILKKANAAVEAAMKKDDLPKLKEACQVWVAAAKKLGGYSARMSALKEAFKHLETSEQEIKAAMSSNDAKKLKAACKKNLAAGDNFEQALNDAKDKFGL